MEELYVRPAFRGHGLGHEFFAWLRGLAAAEHIRRIRLETEPENERAAALYARMGFSPLGYCQMFREEATLSILTTPPRPGPAPRLLRP